MTKETKREYNRAYYKKNIEKIREYKNNWRKNNPESVKKSLRKWYLKNSDKMKKTVKEWVKNNPEKVKQYNQTFKNKNVKSRESASNYGNKWHWNDKSIVSDKLSKDEITARMTGRTIKAVYSVRSRIKRKQKLGK